MSELRILVLSNIFPDSVNRSRGIFVLRTVELLKDVALPRLIVVKNGVLFRKWWNFLTYVFDVKKELDRNSYDSLYIHYANHSLLPFVLWPRIWKRQRVVLNVHGGDIIPIGVSNKLISLITRHLLFKAHVIIFPSNFIRDRFLAMYPRFCGECHVYPSGGVDTDLLVPSPRIEGTLELSLGYYGRIEEGKGWEVFVQCLILLHGRIKWKGIVAGYGRDSESMKRIVLQRKLNVEFLGSINQEQLPSLFERMDLLIFSTNREESLGLVALEAMACGVPVIASNLGAIPEYVKHKENGYLVEAGVANEFAEAVLDFASLPFVLRNQMRERAREKAIEYDTRVTKERLLNVFSQVSHK